MALKNQDLSSPTVITSLLQSLRSAIPDDYPTPTLVTAEALTRMGRRRYVVTPGQSGCQVWLMTVILSGVHYAVAIPCADLQGRRGPRVWPLDIQFTARAYQGTLLRGVSYREGQTRHYVVEDIYQCYGRSTLRQSRSRRMEELRTFINQAIRMTETMRLHRALLYETRDLQSMTSLVRRVREDGLVRLQSLVFSPESWGGPVYIYYPTPADLGGQGDQYTVCLMRASGQPDVYLLTGLGGEEMGVASVPDLQTSRSCREMLAGETQVRVRCRLDTRTDKWIPISVESS